MKNRVPTIKELIRLGLVPADSLDFRTSHNYFKKGLKISLKTLGISKYQRED
jgi:hypothetical protein